MVSGDVQRAQFASSPQRFSAVAAIALFFFSHTLLHTFVISLCFTPFHTLWPEDPHIGA